MTDDDSDPEMSWENITREAKAVVYEHLYEAAAKHKKDAAAAALLRDVAMSMSADPKEIAVRVAAVELVQFSIAMAFELAIAQLEAADPDICSDCGGYHDPTVHPKDLS
jgi:hypothetical protein